MPKMKTSKGAKKRFKVTGAGKLLRRHGMRGHNLEKKSSKRRRGFRNYIGEHGYFLALRPRRGVIALQKGIGLLQKVLGIAHGWDLARSRWCIS